MPTVRTIYSVAHKKATVLLSTRLNFSQNLAPTFLHNPVPTLRRMYSNCLQSAAPGDEKSLSVLPVTHELDFFSYLMRPLCCRLAILSQHIRSLPCIYQDGLDSRPRACVSTNGVATRAVYDMSYYILPSSVCTLHATGWRPAQLSHSLFGKQQKNARTTLCAKKNGPHWRVYINNLNDKGLAVP